MDHVLRQRMGHGRRGERVGPDLAPAAADQTLIGRDQGDVGIDPEPTIAREHLHIEMQMAAGPVGMVQIIRNHADFLAFADTASVQHAVGIHGGRIHVHIAKADVFAAGVDLQRCPLLLQRTDHYAVPDSDHRPLFGIAAVGTFVNSRTRRRTNILALMAKSARALSDAKTSSLAEGILPWIAGIAANRLVDWQQYQLSMAGYLLRGSKFWRRTVPWI